MKYEVGIMLNVRVESESISQFYQNFGYWLRHELTGLGDGFKHENTTLQSALVTELYPLSPEGAQEVQPPPNTDSDIALTPEEEKAAADLLF